MPESTWIKAIVARASPPGRILVVDDEPALLRAYVRWVEAAGCVVESATDSASAALLIADKRFEVIVSDRTGACVS